MARKSKSEKPEVSSPVEPEGGMNKTEAARQALLAGKESPVEAVAFIRQRFAIEMSPQHFSATKSLIRKKERETTPPVTARRTPVRQEDARPNNGDTGVMEAMEAIKPLIATLGAEKVKRIVDLLG